GGVMVAGLRSAGQNFHLFVQSYGPDGVLSWESEDPTALPWRALTGMAFEASHGSVCVHGTRSIDGEPGPHAQLVCRTTRAGFRGLASEGGHSGARAVEPLGLLVSLVNSDSRYFLQTIAP